MGIREIIFRGKQLDNGKWIYGWYSEACFGSWPLLPAIVPMDDARSGYRRDIEIDPTTLGQYTGLTDKNGKRIFEGDIVRTHYKNAAKADFVETVVFINGRFCAESNIGKNGKAWATLWDGVNHVPQDKSVYMDSIEVIGNIHDNKEFDARNGEEKEE